MSPYIRLHCHIMRWMVLAIISLGAQFGLAADAPTSQPAAPGKASWAANPLEKWPQLLLTNEIRLKATDPINGASAFLMRLPNDAIIVATARHLLGDNISLEQFRTALVSWTVFPRGMPSQRITVQKMAMKLEPAATMDCLLMNVAPRRNWPVEILTPRQGEIHVGDMVYLIALPYEEKGTQNIYKTIVRHITPDHQVLYDLSDKIQTRGFSGAPVVDTEGNLVAMHLGKGTMSTGQVFGRAILASALVEIADAPAPRTASSLTAPNTTQAELAAKALTMARNYIVMQKYDKAREKLRAIQQSYPDTPAAEEARKLLQEIADK